MSATTRLQPPVEAQAIDPTTQDHSPAWARHHQRVTDALADQQSQITDLQTQLAASRHGVTDGSDAAAGDIGEYLTTSAGPLAISNAVVLAVATLSLPAGDWQVQGNINFLPAAATHPLEYVASVSMSSTALGGIQTNIVASMANGSSASISTGGAVRVNVSATTPVYLVALTGFTGGTMQAGGTIAARRVR
jgi:hypothetical protein